MNDARRLLGIQAVLVASAAVVYFLIEGAFAAQSVLYGGGAALAATWMLQRRVRRALEVARTAPGRETSVLYAGALQRFFLVAGLFALGIGGLKLGPLPLLVGFAVAQMAFFLQRLGGEERAAG